MEMNINIYNNTEIHYEITVNNYYYYYTQWYEPRTDYVVNTYQEVKYHYLYIQRDIIQSVSDHTQ